MSTLNNKKANKIIGDVVDDALASAFQARCKSSRKNMWKLFIRDVKDMFTIRFGLFFILMMVAIPLHVLTRIMIFFTFNWVIGIQRGYSKTNNMEHVQKVVEGSGINIPRNSIEYRPNYFEGNMILGAETIAAGPGHIIFYRASSCYSDKMIIKLLKHEMIHRQQIIDNRLDMVGTGINRMITWEGVTKHHEEWRVINKYHLKDAKNFNFRQLLMFQFDNLLSMRFVPWEKEAYHIDGIFSKLYAVYFVLLVQIFNFPQTLISYWSSRISQRFPKK